MRVEQAIEYVKEWVDARASQIPGFRGAHLMGSILSMPRNASFPAYKDVDFNIVREGSHETETHDVAYKGLILEYSVVSPERYRGPEDVLASPELAANLAVDSVIADPFGVLVPLQGAVAAHYADRRWVQARCAYEKQIVEQALAGLGQATAPIETLWPLGNLALFLSGLLAEASLRPPTHRRSLAVMREVLHDQGCAELHEAMLNLLGYGRLTRRQVEGFLDDCAAAFDCAATVTRTPVMFQFKLQPHVRPYIVEGAREMIAQGYHREAMFWIGGFLMFANAAIQADAPVEERAVYQASVDRLVGDVGPGSAADVGERARVARDLAQAVYGVADALIERLPG